MGALGSRECLRIFRGSSSGTCYTLGFVLLTDIWLGANLAFQRIEEDKLEECNQRRLVKFIFCSFSNSTLFVSPSNSIEFHNHAQNVQARHQSEA